MVITPLLVRTNCAAHFCTGCRQARQDSAAPEAVFLGDATPALDAVRPCHHAATLRQDLPRLVTERPLDAFSCISSTENEENAGVSDALSVDMAGSTLEHPTNLLDQDVVGLDGARLGAVAQIFLDRRTGRPKWVAVAGSPLSKRWRVLPLVGAVLSSDGLRLPFDGWTVVNAPQLEGSTDRLSEQHEALLHRFYYSSRPADLSRVGLS